MSNFNFSIGWSPVIAIMAFVFIFWGDPDLWDNAHTYLMHITTVGDAQ